MADKLAACSGYCSAEMLAAHLALRLVAPKGMHLGVQTAAMKADQWADAMVVQMAQSSAECSDWCLVEHLVASTELHLAGSMAATKALPSAV